MIGARTARVLYKPENKKKIISQIGFNFNIQKKALTTQIINLNKPLPYTILYTILNGFPQWSKKRKLKNIKPEGATTSQKKLSQIALIAHRWLHR